MVGGRCFPGKVSVPVLNQNMNKDKIGKNVEKRTFQWNIYSNL